MNKKITVILSIVVTVACIFTMCFSIMTLLEVKNIEGKISTSNKATDSDSDIDNSDLTDGISDEESDTSILDYASSLDSIPNEVKQTTSYKYFEDMLSDGKKLVVTTDDTIYSYIRTGDSIIQSVVDKETNGNEFKQVAYTDGNTAYMVDGVAKEYYSYELSDAEKEVRNSFMENVLGSMFVGVEYSGEKEGYEVFKLPSDDSSSSTSSTSSTADETDGNIYMKLENNEIKAEMRTADGKVDNTTIYKVSDITDDDKALMTTEGCEFVDVNDLPSVPDGTSAESKTESSKSESKTESKTESSKSESKTESSKSESSKSESST